MDFWPFEWITVVLLASGFWLLVTGLNSVYNLIPILNLIKKIERNQ